LIGHLLPPLRAGRRHSTLIAASRQAPCNSVFELSAIAWRDQLVEIWTAELGNRADGGSHEGGSARVRFEQRIRHPFPRAWQQRHIRRAVVVRQVAVCDAAGEHHVLRQICCRDLRLQRTLQRSVPDEIQT